MYILNLSEGFDPLSASEADTITFDAFEFNGGEPHIKITDVPYITNRKVSCTITHRINSMSDLGLLLVATEALRGLAYFHKIHLIIPYFPGARQDRRMVYGEPLTVKVYTNLINSLYFSSVTIFDPHSDVTPALLNDVIVIDNHELVRDAIENILEDSAWTKVYLVVPDAGATKKATQLAASVRGIAGIIQCEKKRDVETGKLTGFKAEIDKDMMDYPLVLVDDICDGGGTFLGLAVELDSDDLHLVISHGIFSKGFKELAKYYTSIHTTNSIVDDYGWDIPEIEKGSEVVTIHEILINDAG